MLSLAVAVAPALSAQTPGDEANKKGATRRVSVDCDTFARIAETFLSDRGLKSAHDWACETGRRCVVFGNAPPRAVDGRTLSRNDVVRDYLTDPAKADFKWKNLTHGYWAVPDRNFVMGASLTLTPETPSCSANLRMGFVLSGTVLLGILPFERNSWSIPSNNGRLQSDYLTEIIRRLQQ